MILLDTHVVSEPLRATLDASVGAWFDAQPLDTRRRQRPGRGYPRHRPLRGRQGDGDRPLAGLG